MEKKKYNLIVFGFNPWSNFWKRNQTITSMLSKHAIIDQVLFINSEVWLSDFIRNPIFELSEPQINKWNALKLRKVQNKIKAFTPVRLPAFERVKLVEYFNEKLNNLVFNKYLSKPFILLINDPQANQNDVDRCAEKSSFTIFDWSDDFVEFSNDLEERKICASKCKKYCEISNVVFTVNERLRSRAKYYNVEAYTIRNATNCFTFYNKLQNIQVKKKLKNSHNFLIGYVGWLNSSRLDLDLLNYIIPKRPDTQFLFIGPKSEPFPLGYEIPNFRNVKLLPAVKYVDYPSYISALDICILPNKISPHTDGNDPIKIYDYLFSGNPIVCTNTAGTEAFSDYLYCADDKYQFLENIDVAFYSDTETMRENRVEVAKNNSWQHRFIEIEKILAPHFEDLKCDE